MSRLVWIAPILLTGLSACGFQLRGATPLPAELKSMRLECPTAKERVFCQALERQLALNGIDSEAASPNYVLEIQDVEAQRRALSINERGVASEVQLDLVAGFTLAETGGAPILPLTRVSAAQSYRNDQNQVLGKGREEQQIRRDLSQQMALQILNRLGALTSERLAELAKANTASPDTAPVDANQDRMPEGPR